MTGQTIRIARIAAAATLSLTSAAALAAPEPSFCERLAQDIGFKPVQTRHAQGAPATEWRVNTASLGQYLIGGTVVTRLSVEPVDAMRGSAEDYRRAREMCDVTKKGAECRIVGPAVLNIATRRGEARAEAHAGERAIVEVRNTRVYCRAG